MPTNEELRQERCRIQIGPWPEMALPEGDTHFKPKKTYQAYLFVLALAYTEGRSVAVDVGAHVGYMSRLMTGAFDTVHAFEPDAECARCLRINVPLACVYELALGVRKGRCRIKRIAKSNSGSGEMRPGDDVEVTTLDDAFRDIERLDFLKVDVQGADAEVLAGGHNTIERLRPTILCEGDAMGAAEILLRMWGAIIPARSGRNFIATWRSCWAADWGF